MTKQLMIAVCATLMLTACHHKTPPETDPQGGRSSEGMVPAIGLLNQAAHDQAVEQAVADLRKNFKRVHFDYDSSTLTAASKQALTENVAILKSNPNLKVEIQGHCDERGTTDYNLSLGQTRAEAVLKFLVNSGVTRSQLTTVSYGEERPLASGSSEQAFAQNRRAEFRVTVGGDGVVEDTLSQPADKMSL